MQATALSISRLTVRYGPTTALDAADLEIGAGQVHALLGENGAGKSTIVKVLSGLVRPNAGGLAVFGHNVARFEPRYANALGIRTAFQEISLVKDLTVAQNFMLMEEPLNALGMVRGRALDDMVRARLEQLGISSIDPRTEVRRLDLPSRQKIEIARAISGNPRILLLDEPTASLSNRDVQWLGDVIERLKRSGTTIVLISHRMQEVRAFCSAMTIFRNGRTVGAYAMDDLADAEIIELMIGRSLGAAFPPKRDRAEVELRRPHRFSHVKTSQPRAAAIFHSRCVPAKYWALAVWTVWGSASFSWRSSACSSPLRERSGSAGKRCNCARRQKP